MEKKFNVKRFILFLFVLFIICVLLVVGTYLYMIKAPSKESNQVNIYIDKGSTYSTIASKLKENNLIKSELAYKIYIKLNTPEKSLEYGNYSLKTNYDLKELINILGKGSTTLMDTVKVTFIEGKNMRQYMKVITDNFNISEDEILSKLSNEEYIDTLIKDYWFLTDEIKNKDIYYSLEGYLYPDTYEFYESADIDDIFRKLLSNMGKKLEPYKASIEKNGKTIHEIITLASIVELEEANSSDRKAVAGVFYNRLKDNWSLGSDVTTYYAEKIDGFERDLKLSELNACNAYNTRSSCMSGKLPVGPICNVSLDSLVAAINPEKHYYYYFAADKTGKTHFTKTESEHNALINKLKREGLWLR